MSDFVQWRLTDATNFSPKVRAISRVIELLDDNLSVRSPNRWYDHNYTPENVKLTTGLDVELKEAFSLFDKGPFPTTLSFHLSKIVSKHCRPYRPTSNITLPSSSVY